MTDDGQQGDICRVCRSEGAPDKPLFYPCVCTGSIKYIHQDCLVQWLKYSRKEYCELCKHRFAFTPIYSPDMPKRLPIQDIVGGLLKSVGRAIRYWFHYTLVAVAWLGVVPLTACRIYRCLFTGSVSSLLMLPLDMLSTDNLVSDCFQGCFVVTCTLCAFISLVWLREQILHGRGPDWLDNEQEQAAAANQRQNEPQAAAGANGAQPAAPNQNAGNQGNPNRGRARRMNFLDMIGLDGEEEEEDEEAEPADPQAADNDNGANGAAQDDNWNPIEWDRAAEELTWERLLGLDGSLVFLEHVFWVVSLNTLFILVFAFCPYHIGHFTIIGFKFNDYIAASQFEGLLTTLVGYVLIALFLVLLHGVISLASLHRSQRVLGLCYIVVKVSLLVVAEIGVFPLICGWWLDICSLSMFDASLKDRENSFRVAPGTSMFIHWLVGMVYVFYFASFILLLREVLRPGVLWFLRNLNDPDFNPIQEMIHLPVYRHVRRFLTSMMIFGSTVLMMLWLPVRIIRYFLPGFLPYNVMLSSDAPVSELSLELLLLQVVLPALLEQGHTRQWLKNLVRGWCLMVAWVLGLRSYLLGDVPLDNKQPQMPEDIVEPRVPAEDGAAAAEPIEPVDAAEPILVQPGEAAAQAEDVEVPGVDPAALVVEPAAPVVVPAVAAPGQVVAPVLGLGAAHQAMLQGGGPTGFQPYERSQYFTLKLTSLLAMMCVTLFLCSLVSYVLPVYLGRRLMSIWMGETRSHELYTAACGLYTCWLIMRAGSILYTWIPQGFGVIFTRVLEWASLYSWAPQGSGVYVSLIREWVLVVVKSVIVVGLLLGLVPLLLGLLFELVIVVPLRAPLNMTPVFFPWQDWALGVLHAKIICAATMMGPQWWLKRVMEQVYNQGFRQMDLLFIVTNLCFPVIGVLGMALSLPYITARSFVPALGFGADIENLVLRRIYPCMLSIIMIFSFCVFQMKQFKKLYEHIKNDKYLVGQRLVNYERRQKSATPPPVSAAVL